MAALERDDTPKDTMTIVTLTERGAVVTITVPDLKNMQSVIK